MVGAAAALFGIGFKPSCWRLKDCCGYFAAQWLDVLSIKVMRLVCWGGSMSVAAAWQWHGASCVGSLRCVNHCRAHGAIQHQLNSSANYSMQFHLSLFDAASRMVGQSVHIHPNSAKEIQQYKRH